MQKFRLNTANKFGEVTNCDLTNYNHQSKGEKTMDKNELIIIDEENIKDLIYEIRGQKVMLDFDLAKIYGYTTGNFNNQIKRNNNRFPEDFMFKLTTDEWKEILILHFEIASWGGRRTPPYVFTEQGIYMLMTVLKGELAIKQSLALIRLFKSMKDYIVESENIVTVNEILKLSKQIDSNTNKIKRIENKLEVVMDNFIDTSIYKHFLILNGKRVEADIVFQSIYSLANQSIIIIDDYINIKTLEHLKVCKKDIVINVFSDNVARKPLEENEINDFIADTGINLVVRPTNNEIHDRYIVIDYNTENEMLYLCGSSSKDAGNRISTIIKIEHSEVYHQLFDKLLYGSTLNQNIE